jgi:hypothetical protein
MKTRISRFKNHQGGYVDFCAGLADELTDSEVAALLFDTLGHAAEFITTVRGFGYPLCQPNE